MNGQSVIWKTVPWYTMPYKNGWREYKEKMHYIDNTDLLNECHGCKSIPCQKQVFFYSTVKIFSFIIL